MLFKGLFTANKGIGNCMFFPTKTKFMPSFHLTPVAKVFTYFDNRQ